MVNIIIYLKRNQHEFLTFAHEKPFLPISKTIFAYPQSKQPECIIIAK